MKKFLRNCLIVFLLVGLAGSITDMLTPAHTHVWNDATCTVPQTCLECAQQNGEPLGHKEGTWECVVEATCETTGKEKTSCTVCNEILERDTEKKSHIEGEWVIVQQPTLTQDGKQAKTCVNCGIELINEAIKLSADDYRDLFKRECKRLTYEEIARNPERYKGSYAKFEGEVIQVIENGDEYTLRVCITESYDSWFGSSWSDAIYVTYTKAQANESRILENDIVTMYGVLDGTITYETIWGNSLTVPNFNAKYITQGLWIDMEEADWEGLN